MTFESVPPIEVPRGTFDGDFDRPHHRWLSGVRLLAESGPTDLYEVAVDQYRVFVITNIGRHPDATGALVGGRTNGLPALELSGLGYKGWIRWARGDVDTHETSHRATPIDVLQATLRYIWQPGNAIGAEARLHLLRDEFIRSHERRGWPSPRSTRP